jgi:hypothetical protein
MENQVMFTIEDIKAAIDFGKDIRFQNTFITSFTNAIDYQDATNEENEFLNELIAKNTNQ